MVVLMETKATTHLVGSQKLLCSNLIARLMIFGDEDSKRTLAHVSRTIINRISAFIRKASSLTCLLCKDIGKRDYLWIKNLAKTKSQVYKCIEI
jgi:hypothetical protein